MSCRYLQCADAAGDAKACARAHLYALARDVHVPPSKRTTRNLQQEKIFM